MSLSTNQRVVEKGGKMRQQCGHWQSKQESFTEYIILSEVYSVKLKSTYTFDLFHYWQINAPVYCLLI